MIPTAAIGWHRPRDRWEWGIIVGAVVAGIVTVALAVAAVAARSRVRAAALASLGNYASVATEQFANGFEAIVRQQIVPALPPTGASEPTSPSGPPSLAGLVDAVHRLQRDPCQCHSAVRPRALFRLGPRPDQVSVVDDQGQPTEGLGAVTEAAFRRAADSLATLGWRYGYLATPEGPRPLSVAFLSHRADPGSGGGWVYGILVPADVVAAEVFGAAFASSRLVPRHLLAAVRDNANYLALEVRTADGRLLYGSAPEYRDGPSDALTLPLPRGGMVVTARLNPAFKDDLVPGGIPAPMPARELAMYGLTLLLIGGVAGMGIRIADLARLRSDFASSITHELRTPLTQIRLAAETVRYGRSKDAVAADRSLGSIVDETERLQQLIDNVLHFSRAERRLTRIAPERFTLAPVVVDIVARFEPLAAGRNIQWVVRVPPDLVVNADPGAVRQILLNLLDNAVRYGPEGQRIVVGARGTGTAVELWVEDEGPGIPAGERDRVWDPFVRLERDRETAATGSGLGLAVVRDLVGAHRGRGTIADGAAGGTRVTVELPVVEDR